MVAPVIRREAKLVAVASAELSDDGVSDVESQEDDKVTLNTVDQLRKGTVKTRKHKAGEPYTILLVGETGVGKSAVLEFIANVLVGNPVFEYVFDVLDQTNESGGSQSGSQTNAARVYDLTSNSGQVVRILDTPGLADTRGLQQDEIHKRSIAKKIKDNLDSVNAVVILANGTVPRITVGTDYALSTLSAIFPKSLANNIAFMFTNVSSPLSWNFAQDTVPPILKDAPHFLLDNPIALQKKYDKLKSTAKSRKILPAMRKAVKAGEESALGMLVDVFDWLDTLTPQPTTEILDLYEKSQSIEAQISNTLAQMEQVSAKKKETVKLMALIRSGNADVEAFSKYEQEITSYVWKQQHSTEHNTLCSETGCYMNCHEFCTLDFTLDPKGLKGCTAMRGSSSCAMCGHTLWSHHHYRVRWERVPDRQTSVDENMKKKWEEAKEGTARDAAALATLQETLDSLTKSVEENTAELAALASDYAGLALSGSFSAQVEKAINLLELKLKSMQEGGVDREQLEKVQASLDAMKKKLELLKKANAEAKEQTTYVRRVLDQMAWIR